ncbi:MAG: substrate-binding domain-containing protein [Faecalicatena sp.]|uniref:substrate-binding domain-containing protein n=1 Tax=Faecalicatena sp. TaxID=2005360 RepID=UPI002589B45E|nr:substrate-binding domain-containing protein [Faecalicatena sp.]MCI6464599.1 substrate-binding domain-containing protein [Faecalicatena sp.]MDY5620919.1 substrate-binding domain-containing protein [Lachnospiraceae bacterium]
MKRKVTLLLCLALTGTMVLGGCGSSKGDSDGGEKDASKDSQKTKWASTDETFNPLDEKDAISFEDLREKLGAISKSDKEFSFAGNVKAFENVVWQEIANGYEGFADDAKAAGRKLTVDTTSPMGESDEEGQLSILKDQVRQGVNAVLLSPISDANCLPGIEAAHDADIPVFAVNNEFNGADMFVGPNSLEQGEIAAEWVNDKIGGKGEVAIVMGMAKTGVTRNRTEGFESWFKENNPDIEVVAKQNADWDRSKAKDVAATFLKTYPDLKAVFCNNDVMALGVVEAVKEANLELNKDIYVIGCDGQSEAYDSIRAGEMAATIDSFPYYEGYMAAEVCYRWMIGQDVPKVVFTPCRMLDSTNVDKTAEENLGWEAPTFE